MPTVIGARFDEGVVIAGDRRAVRNGRIASDEFRRVFDVDGSAIGSPGSTSGVDALIQTVQDEVRTYKQRENSSVSSSAFERILVVATRETGVEALGAVRRDGGTTELLRFDSDGGVIRDETGAIGTGAAIAAGQLESMETDRSVANGQEALEDVLTVVEDRDTETGPTTDAVTILDEN